MSYDVTLEIETAEEPLAVFDRNYTSNTSRVWIDAGCNLRDHDGSDAHGLGIALSLAIADIEFRPGHYAQYEPDNGWGSVDGTLEFLRAIQQACERFPTAVVRVSS